jgi:hypothetical protein
MSGWVAGATIGAGLLGASASRSAAGTQAAAADRAAELQRQTAQEQLALQKQMYEEGVARQEPWRAAGVEALNKLIPASEYTPFGAAQFQQDLGLAFRLEEGRKQIERQAAARGGLISGAALKAAQRYGQEMASQEYQNAFNRSLVERQAALSPLQYLVGGGQTSTQQVGQAGQQYGRDVANLYTDIGASQAGAQLARGTTYAGALTGAANLYGQQQQNLLNQQLTNALIGRLQG